jgi:hypothetical protein
LKNSPAKGVEKKKEPDPDFLGLMHKKEEESKG